jgi:hypothetical protein
MFCNRIPIHTTLDPWEICNKATGHRQLETQLEYDYAYKTRAPSPKIDHQGLSFMPGSALVLPVLSTVGGLAIIPVEKEQSHR